MNLGNIFLRLIPFALLFEFVVNILAYKQGRCVEGYRGFGTWCGVELLGIACVELIVCIISCYLLLKKKRNIRGREIEAKLDIAMDSCVTIEEWRKKMMSGYETISS